MRRLALTAALTLFFLSLAGTPSHSAEDFDKIIFGGSNEYAPFYFKNKKGQAVGYDISLFNSIIEKMGREVSYQFNDWDRILADLSIGLIDVVPMFVSDSRAQQFLFSDPILIIDHLIFGLEGTGNHASLQSLAGFRVAAERGGYAINEIELQGINAQLIRTNSEAEALEYVINGQADFAIIPAHVARQTIADKGLTGLIRVSPPLLPVTYAYAFAPEQSALIDPINTILLNLQREGIREQLYNDWLSPPDRQSWGLANLLSIGLLLFILALIVISRTTLRPWFAKQRYAHKETRVKQSLIPSIQPFLAHSEQCLSRIREKHKLVLGILHPTDLLNGRNTIGDEVLEDLIRQVGDKLLKFDIGFIGDLGDGNYSILFEEGPGENFASLQMSALLEKLNGRYSVQELTIPLEMVGGMAIFPHDATSASALLRKARLALDIAQKRGVKQLMYEPSMEPDPKNLTLMSDIDNALSSKQLHWLFQPQYDIRHRRITGAEMLIRWHHDRYGWISPDEFIPLAEKSGNIKKITRELVSQAVHTLRLLDKRELRMSINVSATDLADREGVDWILTAIEGVGHRITMEVTETAFMADKESVIANIERLKKKGVWLALDDYGTGYSSLSYLKEFSFDEIKIDKSFVIDVVRVPRHLKLVQSTIKLGHDLGATIVAEGVEDTETARLLIDLNCDILQGYGIAKPVSLQEFVELVDTFTLD